jgi:hypothetical protein
VDKRWWSAGLALVVGAAFVVLPLDSDCAAEADLKPQTQVQTTTQTTTGTPHAAAPRIETPDLQAAVKQAVEANDNADLGVAVIDLETGTAAGSQADAPFRTASLSKLIIAVDGLLSGELDDTDRDYLRRALSVSDDNAMNALWTLHDGMGAVRRVAELLKLTATTQPEDASQWGDVRMSADDVARLYRYVLTDLPRADRDFVVQALSSAPATAADGFDQAFGLLAQDGNAYAKQGWMWYFPADLYLHSAGVVANRYVVVLLSVQKNKTEQRGKDNLTAVTKALLAGIEAG